jgi:hypothetical protein
MTFSSLPYPFSELVLSIMLSSLLSPFRELMLFILFFFSVYGY